MDGKRLGHSNRLYIRNKCRAQALIELALFGSILIMLLGVLISYGLRYYNQQKVTQEAFRKAMATASATNIQRVPDFTVSFTPSSITHLVIRDEAIPNPTDPWAVGNVQSFQSGAAVTRNYKGHESADIWSMGMELPSMWVYTNGDPNPQKFKTAGFRIGVGLKAVADAVYGASNVGEMPGTSKISKKVSLPGLEIGVYIIQDPAGGQVFDYDQAARECELLTNSMAAIDECIGSLSITNFIVNAIVGAMDGGGIGAAVQPFLNQFSCLASAVGPAGLVIIPPPTHCFAGKTPDGKFVGVEDIFRTVPVNSTGSKTLGVQVSATTIDTRKNKFNKTEDSAKIATVDTRDWKTINSREVYVNQGLLAGFQAGYNVKKETLDSEVSQNETREWKTNW